MDEIGILTHVSVSDFQIIADIIENTRGVDSASEALVWALRQYGPRASGSKRRPNRTGSTGSTNINASAGILDEIVLEPGDASSILEVKAKGTKRGKGRNVGVIANRNELAKLGLTDYNFGKIVLK